MLKIRLPEEITACRNEPENKTYKVNWKDADHENILEYKEILHNKLSLLRMPDNLCCSDVICKNHDHSNDRDSFLIDILFNIIETRFDCLPTKNVKGNPRKSQNFNFLPDWKENVLPLKNDSLFWHALWISAG